MYAEHIFLDETEEVKSKISIAEYAMAFHNYDAVKRVQEDRERNENIESGSETDDIFFKQLKEMGIDLDKEDLSKNRKRNSQEDEDEEDLDDVRVVK